MSSVAADLGHPRRADAATPTVPIVPTLPLAPAEDPAAASAPPASLVRRLAPLIASALATVGAAVLAIAIVPYVGELGSYGPLAYPALFLIQTLMSATLFLPAPGAAVVVGAGTFLDPIWVGVVAGLGSATGELTGYLLGFYGRRAVPVDRSRLWRLTERGFRRWGFVALFVLALIPNPLFDTLGILAGCMRYPVARFWAATAAGKTARCFLLAYGGWLAALWWAGLGG